MKKITSILFVAMMIGCASAPTSKTVTPDGKVIVTKCTCKADEVCVKKQTLKKALNIIKNGK